MRFEAASAEQYRRLRLPWPWPNFTVDEMACKGTGRVVIDPEFMDALQALRSRLGIPLVITSGYRTPAYNAQVSDTGTTGPHTRAASDIKCLASGTRARLVSAAFALGFTGIGIAPTFVHVDRIPAGDLTISRPALWLY